MSYNFWNDFVDDWKCLPIHNYKTGKTIGGWSNPVGVLIHPSIKGHNANTTFEFIPEPWWGAAVYAELHAVIVNYNPGSGGYGQSIYHPDLRTLYRNSNYQEFVKCEVDNFVREGVNSTNFNKTNDWHYNKRAIPVRDALKANGISLPKTPKGYANDIFYKSCLSIELVPWHTKNIRDINNYLFVNLSAVKDVLDFAAKCSSVIGNNKLQNRVILKMSHNALTRILKKMKKSGIIKNYINTSRSETFPSYPIMNAKFSTYSIDDFPNIEFTCIWMPDSFRDRMALPNQPDLNWIFTNVF